MKEKRKSNLKNQILQIIPVFIGVFLAFSLSNLNETNKEKNSERKILREIRNGLDQDLSDINSNIRGHEMGIKAVEYFDAVISKKEVTNDSLELYYSNLFRDFISVQNISGYETLKSGGLYLIRNDDLRTNIISLYENKYNGIRKIEETYSEVQFHDSYFNYFNSILAPNFEFNDEGEPIGINQPIKILEEEAKVLRIYLWKIKRNRTFVLKTYNQLIKEIEKLENEIDGYLM